MLSEQILNNPNFVQCIKTKTFEWVSKNCKNWQCEVALNKKSLSEFTHFSLALRNYVIMIIKQTIAKILYLLEKLSAMSTFFNNENNESNVKKELSDLWKQFFMDNTIINIDNLSEPKPSVYMMTCSVNELEFPFSYYFMNQINYYKNFIKIVLSTYHIRLASKEKLDFILRSLIGVTGNEIVDPFILHIYLWKFENEILIQLKLVESFPHIITKAKSDFIVHGKLDQYTFRESINSVLQNIYDDKPWKQDMDY